MPVRFLCSTALALFAAGLATAADPIHCPPGCLPGPHVETVKRSAYGTKGETFCLPKVTLRGLWQSLVGGGCAPVECEPPRCRVRLVKWEVTEQRCTVRCAPSPIAGPITLWPFPPTPPPLPPTAGPPKSK